jgi:hypothetical protein
MVINPLKKNEGYIVIYIYTSFVFFINLFNHIKCLLDKLLTHNSYLNKKHKDYHWIYSLGQS